ncbi:hypothetical protein [Actinomadura sp. 3N508]|uniref:hypothetical protein n=1 Tax=Actinomadura sp. 3N508 TaxID=3375153 RepID=UPI003789B05E
MVLIAGVIAVLGTAITATLTYALSQRASRRERQVKSFADALAAVEDYAELPYRVRRRLTSDEARHTLTEEISRVQARIAFHQGWLQIEAPHVAVRYDQLVRAAKRQAGGQMKEAWELSPVQADAAMSLGVAYPRTEIDRARRKCLAAMREMVGPMPRPHSTVGPRRVRFQELP